MTSIQFQRRIVATTAVLLCTGAALWVAEPSWQVGALECFLFGWVPSSAAILSANSTGKGKAFWLGFAVEAALPPSIYLARFGAPMFIAKPIGLDFPHFLVDFSRVFRPVLMLWAFAPFVGLLCVGTHWFFVQQPQSNSASIPVHRPWLQFSLRDFLIAVTAFAISLGIIVKPGLEQKRAVDKIKSMGWVVNYDWQTEIEVAWRAADAGQLSVRSPSKPPFSARVRYMEDIAHNVNAVYFLYESSTCDPIIRASIPHLQQIRGLSELKLMGPAQPPPEILEELQAALPLCDIE